MVIYSIDYTPYKVLDWSNKDILNSSLKYLSRNQNAIHDIGEDDYQGSKSLFFK